MHIVFGTALLIIAVLLIVGILSRRHWISTVLAVAIALIGVATIYTSTSIGPSSERQLYARAVLDNLSARLFGSDAGSTEEICNPRTTPAPAGFRHFFSLKRQTLPPFWAGRPRTERCL